MMKVWKYRASVLFSILCLAGCATKTTIASRKLERRAAYASFPPEIKSLVDAGRISAGMTPSAVYIAWGPPDEVLRSGDRNGESMTWVYRGAFLQPTRYWVGRRYPRVTYDYEPRTYIRAEILFANGVVEAWRTLPQPVY